MGLIVSDDGWRISDELWLQIEPLLPPRSGSTPTPVAIAKKHCFRVVVQRSRPYADETLVAYDPRSARSEDAVTPELALVDPVLAERARSRLAEPDDTLARVDTLIQTSRMSSLARRSMEVPGRPVPDLVESRRRISRIGRRRFSVLAGGVAAGALAIALLLGVHVDLRGTPAGADTAVIDEVPVPSVQKMPNAGDETFSQPQAGRTPPAIKPAPQRFAWAPTPGASAYHVELFRGSSKVFEADTKRPAMTIPARWVFDRRSQSLEPGDYRWYVWPVASGQQAARAIVQAKLVVPAR